MTLTKPICHLQPRYRGRRGKKQILNVVVIVVIYYSTACNGIRPILKIVLAWARQTPVDALVEDLVDFRLS